MPVGEIIAIGTELLLGDTQDTNTSYIARAFRDAGIDLYRTMIVGDNIDRIAQAIREALSRADIVITTGGLGPTVDDPTRLAVARAFGVEMEFEPELWEQIQARFQRFHRHATDNNRRQAYIPQVPLLSKIRSVPPPASTSRKAKRSSSACPAYRGRWNSCSSKRCCRC